MLFWVTTAPNPRSATTGYDAGQRGWRMHAVDAPNAKTQFSEIRWVAAACGTLGAHGWSMDLFIDTKCLRCLQALERVGKLSAEDAQALRVIRAGRAA